MGSACVVVAVVKFGDVPLADEGAELAEAPRLLGQVDGDNVFALFADFGTLGDVALEVLVLIGAAGDGNKGFAVQLFAGNVGFHPRNRHRTGRL